MSYASPYTSAMLVPSGDANFAGLALIVFMLILEMIAVLMSLSFV